ncbi:hypothetical protein AGDE_16194 [Angomonas deanei]|nr:hypothetical protein AGDE_16194 [Angomonas deanei]|eukprot:EPY17569.1 hypothetical protein AGDE_16194 [Angomonas deanei]
MYLNLKPSGGGPGTSDEDRGGYNLTSLRTAILSYDGQSDSGSVDSNRSAEHLNYLERFLLPNLSKREIEGKTSFSFSLSEYERLEDAQFVFTDSSVSRGGGVIEVKTDSSVSRESTTPAQEGRSGSPLIRLYSAHFSPSGGNPLVDSINGSECSGSTASQAAVVMQLFFTFSLKLFAKEEEKRTNIQVTEERKFGRLCGAFEAGKERIEKEAKVPLPTPDVDSPFPALAEGDLDKLEEKNKKFLQSLIGRSRTATESRRASNASESNARAESGGTETVGKSVDNTQTYHQDGSAAQPSADGESDISALSDDCTELVILPPTVSTRANAGEGTNDDGEDEGAFSEPEAEEVDGATSAALRDAARALSFSPLLTNPRRRRPPPPPEDED